jgi:hypothetical protein
VRIAGDADNLTIDARIAGLGDDSYSPADCFTCRPEMGCQRLVDDRQAF